MALSTSDSLFKYEFTTRLHDIDAAGVLFFAQTLYYVHDAYEAFLNHNNHSIAVILSSDFILPISHAEADFKTPVLLNENIIIEIFFHDIKEDEFSLFYQLTKQSNKQSNKICSTALTRHVCLNSNTHKRTSLPDSILSFLLQKKNTPRKI